MRIRLRTSYKTVQTARIREHKAGMENSEQKIVEYIEFSSRCSAFESVS